MVFPPKTLVEWAALVFLVLVGLAVAGVVLRVLGGLFTWAEWGLSNWWTDALRRPQWYEHRHWEKPPAFDDGATTPKDR